MVGVTACNFNQNKDSDVVNNDFENFPKELQTQKGNEVNPITINKVKNGKNEIIKNGYKNEILFANKNLSNEQRLSRLEDAVQTISDKLIKIEPTIQRLSEIDNDLSLLTKQLEILLTNNKNLNLPVQQDTNLAIPSQSSEIIDGDDMKQRITNISSDEITSSPIQNIRISDHNNKTRIVFDSTQKFEINALVKDQTNLTAALEQKIQLSNIQLTKNSSLIQNIQLSEKNNILLFKTAKNIKKISSAYLPPDSKNSFHRYYIDVY